MATRKILTIPDERLKNISEPVVRFDGELHAFIAELEETRLASPGAIGIAAPQVAHFQRIIIVDLINMKKPVSNHGHMVLVNPEITHWHGFELGREGCLSVPDYTGNVIRAEQIGLTAQDQWGNSHNYEMTGFEARAIQHEVDHLDGITFLDRLVSRRTDLFQRKVYQKRNKKS